jgi:hypothetical protein
MSSVKRFSPLFSRSLLFSHSLNSALPALTLLSSAWQVKDQGLLETMKTKTAQAIAATKVTVDAVYQVITEHLCLHLTISLRKRRRNLVTVSKLG